MKNKELRNCCRASVLLAISALGLTSLSLRAQPNWLQYQLTVDADYANGNFLSGEVQDTNLLTTFISFPGTRAAASARPTARYGWLQLDAACSVNNTSPDGNGHGAEFLNAVGGGTDVSFQDTLVITSTSLPAGTPVQVKLSCAYFGFITPGSGSGPDTTRSGASIGLNWSDLGAYGSVSGSLGASIQTNTISLVAPAAVGDNLVIVPSIFAYGNANNQDAAYFVGSVSTSISSQTYVDVLTPGANYISTSGTVYPSLAATPPSLGIESATNWVTLFWPVTAAVYRLQQSPDFTAAGWTANTNQVNVVNGTNLVTLPAAPGNMFFRLVTP